MLQPPQAPLPADPGATSHSRAASPGASRLPNVIAIAIAVVALAVAAGAWFRPLPKPEAPATQTYSEQEVAEAKKAVCEAFTKVSRTLTANSAKSSVNPADSFAIVVNTRLAIQSANEFLSRTVASHPSAPPDLSSSIGQLAAAYQAIVFGQIGDASQPELDASYADADRASTAIQQRCI